MPKKKSELQKALGKLISEIQKEWGKELGESNAEFSERVMNLGHDLLQAGSVENIKKTLGHMTIRQYLGEIWIQAHPHVKPTITIIEKLLKPTHTKG